MKTLKRHVPIELFLALGVYLVSFNQPDTPAAKALLVTLLSLVTALALVFLGRLFISGPQLYRELEIKYVKAEENLNLAVQQNEHLLWAQKTSDEILTKALQNRLALGESLIRDLQLSECQLLKEEDLASLGEPAKNYRDWSRATQELLRKCVSTTIEMRFEGIERKEILKMTPNGPPIPASPIVEEQLDFLETIKAELSEGKLKNNDRVTATKYANDIYVEILEAVRDNRIPAQLEGTILPEDHNPSK